jgi:hypothetical protein
MPSVLSSIVYIVAAQSNPFNESHDTLMTTIILL